MLKRISIKDSYVLTYLSAAIFILVIFNLVEAGEYFELKTKSGMLEIEKPFYFDKRDLFELKTKTDAIKFCERYLKSENKNLVEKGFVVLDTFCNKTPVVYVIKKKEDEVLKVKTIESKIIFYSNPKLNKPKDNMKRFKELFYYGNENYQEVKTEADTMKYCKKNLESKSIDLEEKGFVILKSSCEIAGYISYKQVGNEIIKLMVIEGKIMFYPNPKL